MENIVIDYGARASTLTPRDVRMVIEESVKQIGERAFRKLVRDTIEEMRVNGELQPPTYRSNG